MKHINILLGTLLLGGLFSRGLAAEQLADGGNKEAGKPLREVQYRPNGRAFVCENGTNRFTRALYGSHTDYRIETSDKPVFAVTKKGHHRSIRFEVEGVPLESAAYCHASYEDGTRSYILRDDRWKKYSRMGTVRVKVVALHDEEGAIWQLIGDKWNGLLHVTYKVCDIANPKMKRNGDLGVDDRACFDPAPGEPNMESGPTPGFRNFAHLVVKGDQVARIGDITATEMYNNEIDYWKKFCQRIVFDTPDPFVNTLGAALTLAADGDWDGQTWLHGCIGWRSQLPGWRAGYLGDVMGWNDRAKSHFSAYAKSQVNNVPATMGHPTQDPASNMARAEKKWGTQMYSNGYICRTPERNDQMHHYDMNLCYIDELLWHFQYDADPDYMKQMWPVIKSHLDWEKRNFDPDGDHLYDAYCCIWASDALYYSGGAVTHSSAYNYRANLLAARIAELTGQDPTPYAQEAAAILQALTDRMWVTSPLGGGHWAEYQDAMGLKRLHKSAALWSVYTPIDCGAGTQEQFFKATKYVDNIIPHIDVEDTGLRTIATSNWMPYAWSTNNVAPAEVMHTALAYFQAGRAKDGYNLMMANIIDNMYYGQSPANFGQLSYYDAARGECYRDFGDCIGISARTLLQGLFGIIPNALYGECIISPGLPADWNKAQVKTPYLSYKMTRRGDKDVYEITQNFARPLKIVFRLRRHGADDVVVQGTTDRTQTITIPANHNDGQPTAQYLADAEGQRLMREQHMRDREARREPGKLGLAEPTVSKKEKQMNIDKLFNANVADIFKNRYNSPRPATTTLQIPLQGAGDWCSTDYTPEIDDSGFRSLIKGGTFKMQGIGFRTPRDGRNIIYTSLWDNYPSSVTVPLTGKASQAYLLMAGSTNQMQSRIDNGLVVFTYTDNSTDTLRLNNPLNWCPIDQDYYIDGKAFTALKLRPYRVSLKTGAVSRDLGKELGLKESADGRQIPGGAAQMLRMNLNKKKGLKSLTVIPLSNDVVIGLMAVTLHP